MNDADAQSELPLDATPEVPKPEAPTPEISTKLPEKAAELSDIDVRVQQRAAELQADPTELPPPVEPPKAPELTGIDLRLKQIEEYKENAYRHKNKLTANIRRADSDLMKVAALLADRLIEVLKPGPPSDDVAEQTCGSVDELLRVSDHIGKLAELEMKLVKEDNQADPFRLF